MPEQTKTTPNQLGNLLRTIREIKGLSLREVEKGCGISNPMLSQYESGKAEPSLRYAKVLSMFYEIDLNRLGDAL